MRWRVNEASTGGDSAPAASPESSPEETRCIRPQSESNCDPLHNHLHEPDEDDDSDAVHDSSSSSSSAHIGSSSAPVRHSQLAAHGSASSSTSTSTSTSPSSGHDFGTAPALAASSPPSLYEDQDEDQDQDDDEDEDDDEDDPGQDHACPEDASSALAGAPPWKPQSQPSTCEFTHTILNYAQKRESGCKKAEYSATTVDNLGNRWRLIVYVNGNGRASNHHLSLFLQVADADDLDFGWKKNVSYVLTLEHPHGPSLGYTKRNPDKTFKLCPKAIDWGWSQFITSDRIQQEGFVLNDSLTVRAHVTVKASSVNIEPEDAELYLKCAVEEGKVDAVDTCIAQGASVNCQFKDDLYTPLHTACSASANEVALDVLNLLLRKGANCNACNKWRETPLLIAANNGHTEAVAALLRNGADSTLCSEAGWSALTFAAHKGYDEIVSSLINAGATVNSRVTEDFSTPLHKACAGSKSGHLQCVMKLLAAGADVHALNKWKETPLLTAANHGQAATVGVLLNAGADPCKCTDTGWSPLSIAAYKGHDEVVLLLLEKGAPTEEEDPTLSALLQAATKGLPSTVEILLRHGADHTVTTKKGDTALSILVEQNLIDTAVEMVTEYKASVPRCSRDRKKVQRARLLINLRVKQQQREGCSLSLDSDDCTDQDDFDDVSNEALHETGESHNLEPANPKKKKKSLGRTFEKSIENAEAEAKAAADALLLELEQEDAQAQKDEAAASTKRNKKKKKKERERLVKLEEERVKKEKEQREEEERTKFRKAQEEKERKEREAKEQEQREKELLEEAERLAKAAQKRKEKEESERKLKLEQEKKDRDKSNRKVNESGNGKQQSSPREESDKKSSSFSKYLSPEPGKVTSPDSKQRILLMEQPKQLFLPKSPKNMGSSALLPRANKKILDDPTVNITVPRVDDYESLKNKTGALVAPRDSVLLTSPLQKHPSITKVLGIECPAVPVFRREKVAELLNNYTQLSSTTGRANPLSSFNSQTIRSIINKWIIRASQSSLSRLDPLIPSWQDVDLLETFFQRQLISESQRSNMRSLSITMEAAREAGNSLSKACICLAKEVMEYATKIEKHSLDNRSDVSFNISAQDFYVNGSNSSLIVIDWAGRSQIFVPLSTFNKLKCRFCGPPSLFLTCVFNVVMRYSTRRDIVSGTSLDYRLPPATFEMLSSELNVTCELFSDPLFVHRDNRFFGLFDDVDTLFGGLPGFGSDSDEDNHRAVWKNGLSAAIVTGNDSHSTAVHMRRMLNILEQSEGKGIPLSFALFIIMDGLRDFEGASSAIDDFNVVRSWLSDKQLKFLRCFEMLPSGQHYYAVGDGDGQYDPSSHNSIFIMLQNDMGYEHFSLRVNTPQNILGTLIVPKISTMTTINNKSFSKDRGTIDTPPSVTPVPSSPSSSYGQGLVMDSSLSDAFSTSIGVTPTFQHSAMNAVGTPIPSLSSAGTRRRERLFKLVDDGDEEAIADTNSDVVSGMLRNLKNSSIFLREHESSVHDVDIEAISLMGIIPPSLEFDRDDIRGKSRNRDDRQGMRSSRMGNMNIHPAI